MDWKKIAVGIVGALIVVGSVSGWLLNRKKVGEYNGYVAQLRPILSAQDALVRELTRSGRDTPAVVAKRVPGWIKRSEDQLRRFRAIKPKKAALVDLHQHIVERSSLMTGGLKSLQRHLQTKDKAHLQAYKLQFRKAGEAMRAFIRDRGIFFKNNKMKLKK